jgi:hypothetical protein
MNAETPKAHADGRHMRLDAPFELRRAAGWVPLGLSESDDPREQAPAGADGFGRPALARAYGDDELGVSDCRGMAPPLA